MVPGVRMCVLGCRRFDPGDVYDLKVIAGCGFANLPSRRTT